MSGLTGAWVTRLRCRRGYPTRPDRQPADPRGAPPRLRTCRLTAMEFCRPTGSNAGATMSDRCDPVGSSTTASPTIAAGPWLCPTAVSCAAGIVCWSCTWTTALFRETPRPRPGAHGRSSRTRGRTCASWRWRSRLATWARVKAVHGMSLFASGLRRLGFRVTRLSDSTMTRLVRFYFVGLLAIYHPMGWRGAARARARGWPAEAWISTATLLGRYLDIPRP
jgi:hypothetical protein